MKLDKLTSKERMEKLIKGEKIDRVPVIPHMEAFAGKVCNMGTKEFYLNPESSYDAQIWCQELFGYDGGVGYNIPYGFVEEFGGEIEYLQEPRLSFPKIHSRIVNTKEDIDKLIMPNIKESYFGARMLRFNRISHENGTEVGITAGSPMSIAQCIVGAENLIKWTIKEPQLVHKVMRFCTDYILLMAKIHLEEFGAENIGAGIACPMECHSLMSPKTFEKFSLPYIKEIYDKFDDWGIRIGTVHLCGDHRKNLKYWTDYIKLKERTLVTVGSEFELSLLGKELGDKYIIGGNLKNSTLQLKGPREVYNQAEKMIKEMKNFQGGYVLTPDCTLSYLTPSANLYAMIKAARDFGQY